LVSTTETTKSTEEFSVSSVLAVVNENPWARAVIRHCAGWVIIF